MGSKISKAVLVRPHVNSGTVAVPASSDNHDVDVKDSRQDSTLPSLVCVSRSKATAPLDHRSQDDINLSTSTPRIMSTPRRDSDPALRQLQNSTISTHAQSRLASFEQYLVERQMMAIDVEVPAPSHPITQPVVRPPPPQCLFCCMDLPKDGSEVLTPCRQCRSPCCTSCIRNMFVEACRDTTRMPPRCCVPFNIHTAKPYLSAEEIALFRVKYEEWSTPNPIYCPTPTCSAFIPDRLLPQHFRQSKSGARVDSGIGTPTPELFECPTCTSGICVGCRQQAHPGSMCTSEEFGIDADTAALLKAWGYKRCPNCGNGVKRMFGCSHMECRCGANFCWVCLNSINECDGECREYDDDEDEDDFESESESSNGEADTAIATDNTLQEPAPVTAGGGTIIEPSTTPAPRAINLDGGGSRYWADSSLDFGAEPEGDGSQHIGSCTHSFTAYTVPFETALAPLADNMECVKCWSSIHPAIEADLTPTKKKAKTPYWGNANGVRRRGRPSRGGRGAYIPPRGLQRGNATVGTTIGTAPHLSTVVIPPRPLSLGINRQRSSPMEDVRFSDRNGEISGNLLRHSREDARGSSPSALQNDQDPPNDKAASVFANPLPTSSLAHECKYCFILVCQSCKDHVAAEQEAERKRNEVVAEEAECVADGPEHQAEVVTTEPGVGADVAAQVEVVTEEEMPYSLFD